MSISLNLIGRPSFDIDVFLSFLRSHGLSWQRSAGATPVEELTEAAGRVCYMSFGARQSPRSNKEYISNLIALGHESVLEHVVWTFLVAGVSRGFSHQLVRHRVGIAFSQLSQQYHDETDAEFIEPPELLAFPSLRKEWGEAVEKAKSAYSVLLRRLTEAGRARLPDRSNKEWNRAIHSIARSVLPNATETKLVITANARALRHIFTVRGSIPGDSEMRMFSAKALELVRVEAPALFADFETALLSDGSPIVRRLSLGERKD